MITRPIVMEIDLDNFHHNINRIRSIIGEDITIMPVVKANAYGTYLNHRLDILNEFDIVAVAIADEGEKLRNLGYKKEVFILNQPDVEEIDTIIKNDLTIGISSSEFVKFLGNRTENVKVHIEVGTGMGRTGIHPDRTAEYIDIIKAHKNICIEGIYGRCTLYTGRYFDK